MHSDVHAQWCVPLKTTSYTVVATPTTQLLQQAWSYIDYYCMASNVCEELICVVFE